MNSRINCSILTFLFLALISSTAAAQSGACCVDLECVGNMEEPDCAVLGGDWYPEESCPDFVCPVPSRCSDSHLVYWDNGDTDGSQGLSIMNDPYHSVIDDFQVDHFLPAMSGFRMTLVWNTLEPPQATNIDLTIWDDGGDQPGSPIIELETFPLSEIPTGRVWLGRSESLIIVSFVPVNIHPGNYWLEIHLDGPEEAFALAMDDLDGSDILGEPAWIVDTNMNPPLQSTCEVFGQCYGADFCLSGPTWEHPCGNYVLGDYNYNGIFNLSDIIAAFSKLCTGAPESDFLCECPPGSGHVWAVTFDVNSSCTFNVADIVWAFSLTDRVACQFCAPPPLRK